METLLESEDGAVRGASLRVSSGSKSASLRRPIQHLYPLEDAPLLPDSVSETEPTAPSDPCSEPVVNSRRFHPPRVAAQLARRRIEEQLKD